MLSTTLIQILRTFNRKELRDLKKWLYSPMHNQREDVRLLFDYLLEEDALLHDEKLLKNVVWKNVFKKTPFDDARMRQVIYFTQEATETYLIWQEQQRDEVQNRKALAAVYRRRGLAKLYERAARETRHLHAKQPFQNSYFLRNEYLIEQEEYNYRSRLARTTELNLQEISDALDHAFIADKLRQSCIMSSHQNIRKEPYRNELLEPVLEYVVSQNLLRIPAIAVYYYAYKALTEPEEEAFFQLLKIEIEKNNTLFPKLELSDIYLLAINYCINRINNSKENYYAESFDLYKQGFENEVFIQNNEVSRWTFQNAVMAALRVKEYEWVSAFINQYQAYINSKHRETFVNYCLSRLYYEKGDFKKAMQLLRQHEYNDVLINLNAKLLLLKMLYEQDELDVLASLLESMRTYLQRKDINERHKNNYKNIIRFTKKLISLSDYNDPKRQKIKQEIIATHPMSEKEWFLKQLG